MLQDLHISRERNEDENIPILVEERWVAFRGITKIRHLSLLQYLLGVHWASPSLNSCLSSFSSYRDLLDLWSLHPHKTQQKLLVRSISIIKQITTLCTVANQFIFCFFIVSAVIFLFLVFSCYFFFMPSYVASRSYQVLHYAYVILHSHNHHVHCAIHAWHFVACPMCDPCITTSPSFSFSFFLQVPSCPPPLMFIFSPIF